MKPPPDDLPALRAGGKHALARALSALETDPEAPRLLDLLDAAFAAPLGIVAGLTGPPGVGKSTLTHAFVARLRAGGRSVGVIAVDPSSRRSGGALLGDRTRIAAAAEDPGVFVRSMAARDRLGGLSDLTYPAAVLMRALFDVVLVETVGVGQSETDISDCADMVVFCVQPGSGDALQFMKAGIMEVPDLVLVTKGDLGAPAARAAADVRGALSLAAEGARVPVAVVSSESGEGLDAALALLLGGAGDGAKTRAERRRAQVRRWMFAGLRESFGAEGVALLTTFGSEERPFSELARLRRRAREALRHALQAL